MAQRGHKVPASVAPWPSPVWGEGEEGGEAASPHWGEPVSEAFPRAGGVGGPAVQQELWKKARRAGQRSATW